MHLGISGRLCVAAVVRPLLAVRRVHVCVSDDTALNVTANRPRGVSEGRHPTIVKHVKVGGGGAGGGRL